MTFLFRVQKKNPTSLKSFRFKALKAVSDATIGINAYFSSPSNRLGERSHIGRIVMGCVDEQVIPSPSSEMNSQSYRDPQESDLEDREWLVAEHGLGGC